MLGSPIKEKHLANERYILLTLKMKGWPLQNPLGITILDITHNDVLGSFTGKVLCKCLSKEAQVLELQNW